MEWGASFSSYRTYRYALWRITMTISKSYLILKVVLGAMLALAF